MADDMLIYNYLKKEAEYALRNKRLIYVYEAYGQAKMALRLGAITTEQFFELNTMLVRDGINNPKAGLK